MNIVYSETKQFNYRKMVDLYFGTHGLKMTKYNLFKGAIGY